MKIENVDVDQTTTTNTWISNTIGANTTSYFKLRFQPPTGSPVYSSQINITTFPLPTLKYPFLFVLVNFFNINF